MWEEVQNLGLLELLCIPLHFLMILIKPCGISEDTCLKLSMTICLPVIAAEVCTNLVPKKKLCRQSGAYLSCKLYPGDFVLNLCFSVI